MRGHKYHAVRSSVDGHSFDSQAEAAYYRDLKLREKAGDLHDLRVHPKYGIEIGGQRICQVVLDFEYTDRAGRHFVDVKGFYTALSRLKHKLFTAQYGAPVEIVRVRPR